MKTTVTQWLAIALLLGLNSAARAQQNGNTTLLGVGPQQNGKLQSGQNPSLPQLLAQPYSWVTPQLQTSNQAAQVNYDWTFTGDQLGWFEPFDRTAGMGLSPVDDALRAHLSIPKDQGLIVTSLPVNAPAARAGIQQNDVLLKLGETPLAKTEDLEKSLKAMGDKPASLTLLRGGKSEVILVQPRVRVTLGPVQAEPPAFWIGVSVSPLEPALRSQLKLPQNRGLLAIDVVKDSPAAQAQVKVYDILLSLDGKPLDSQEKLVELVQSNGEKSMPLKFVREGKTQTILLTPQRRKPSQHQTVGATTGGLYYQFVRPGAVLNVDPNYQLFHNGQVLSLNTNSGWVDLVGQSDLRVANESRQTEPKLPAAGSTAATTRLDELDAEIKQLRKAIEELNKILKEKK